MRRMTMIAYLALAGGVLGLSNAGRAEPPPPVKLAGRYTHTLHGFSLRPPADTERVRQTSTRRLVAWNKRDEKTAAIRWTLEVLLTHHKATDMAPKDYAQALAKEMAADLNFKVESTDVGTVAGKTAMHFRGPSHGALRQWKRETWVQLEPGEFLVLDIAGPETDKAEMDAILSAVLDSLTLTDPIKAREDRMAALNRGAGVLDKLTDPALKALLADEPNYFTIAQDGQIVGFLKIVEGTARRVDAVGARIVRDGALKVPNAPAQLIHEELFSTAGRQVEWWCRAVVDGVGEKAVGTLAECLKQDEVLLLQAHAKGAKPKSAPYEVPLAIRAAYLPQAFAVLLPRLVDRSKTLTYAFAIFNDVERGFDLRTVQVKGPENLTLGGRSVRAVHLTDQMADDAPVADLWVDDSGRLLRMTTPEGWTVERSDRATVIARFSAELVELDKVVEKLPESVKLMGQSMSAPEKPKPRK